MAQDQIFARRACQSLNLPAERQQTCGSGHQKGFALPLRFWLRADGRGQQIKRVRVSCQTPTTLRRTVGLSALKMAA